MKEFFINVFYLEMFWFMYVEVSYDRILEIDK